MYKLEFTLEQHSPLIHHLGIEEWSGLQSKSVSPMFNVFIAEITTGFRGSIAKKEFINQFINVCEKGVYKNWNAGHCKKCEIKDCKYTGWFRNIRELKSLTFNYDMDFTCEIDKDASYNESIINQKRAHILYKGRKIVCSITCTSRSLRELIQKILPDFFILTGFGYRSSKGYGCFTLEGTTKEYIKSVFKNTFSDHDQIVYYHEITDYDTTKQFSRQVIDACKNADKLNLPRTLSVEEKKIAANAINKKYNGYELMSDFEFDSNKKIIKYSNILTNFKNSLQIEIPDNLLISIFSEGNLKNIFYKMNHVIIDQHWKWIKSGTNYPYQKSLLWEYFCGQYGNKIGWDKRFLKESLKENHNYVFNNLKKNEHEGNEMRFETKNTPNAFLFYRALVGLAEHYEFACNVGKVNIQVKSEDPYIERIPSPVKFKIFDNSVFLIVDSIDENIKDAVFKFFYMQTELKFGIIDSLSIQIPENGLKDCFEKILINTNDIKIGHPLCEQYNHL